MCAGKIQRAISSSVITPTGFDEKNAILESEALQQEIGVVKMNDGNYLMSMVCPHAGDNGGND